MKKEEMRALDRKIILLRNKVVKRRYLKQKVLGWKKILTEIRELEKKLSNANKNGKIRERNKRVFYCIKCRGVTNHYPYKYEVGRGSWGYYCSTWLICIVCEHPIQRPNEIGL